MELSQIEELLRRTYTKAAIIVQDGIVLGEWYWRGADINTPFEVWSVSKSYVCACIGMLIDDKKITSIDDLIGTYIPSWRNTPLKSQATIKNILLHDSGLMDIVGSGQVDELALAINALMLTPPGKITSYNNTACMLISEIISKAAEMDPEHYMREKFWEPAGILNTSWRRDLANNVITYAGIQTTARDLIRFGEVFLNNGVWDGNQIISENWVKESLEEHTRIPFVIDPQGPASPYGYLWWVNIGKSNNYNAFGLFNNFLTIIPQHKIVAVRLMGTDALGHELEPADWIYALNEISK